MLPIIEIRCSDLYKEQNCEYHIAHGKDHIINDRLNLTLGCVTENTDKTAAASKTQKRIFAVFLIIFFTSDYFHNFFVRHITDADI